MNDKLGRVAAITFLTGALAFAAFPAAAQGYAGASVGQYTENDITGESTTGFRFFGGYHFNKNFAAEAGYITAAFEGTTATGLTLAVVGVAPINEQFSVFATVGLFSWSLSNLDLSGTDPFVGVGGLFNVGRNVAVRVEFDSYTLSSDFADTSATALTVGVQFRF
jgi:hypothetical protein